MTDLIIPTTEAEELIVEANEEDDLRVDGGDDSVKVIRDYNQLKNRPKIEGVTLVGDKTFEELGFLEMSNSEIQDIINALV